MWPWCMPTRPIRFGNIGYEPTALWPDLGIMPKAATAVIVTAEEIVDSEVLRANPDRTVLPGFMVDAVVEAPFGAHPTSFSPRYGYDTAMHLEWIGAARDDEAVAGLHGEIRNRSRRLRCVPGGSGRN